MLPPLPSLSLRDVLAHYGVELGRERREVSVLCPVHDESRPSCSVNEAHGLWHCQACGAGGDAFSLIAIKEGLTNPDDFGAVVRFAEEHFGTGGNGVPRKPGRQNPGVPEPQRFARGGFKPAFRNGRRARP